MAQLVPIELDDGAIIYLEANDDISPLKASEVDYSTYAGGDTLRGGEESLIAKGGIDKAVNKFKVIEGTIRAYTTYTLNAFKQMAVANVDKVTLEFGIEVGGKAGIPYVTQGTAKSNLKVKVECSFSKE